LDFFAAGKIFRERALEAANRVGKTTCGAYEVALHATGLYPDWWPGRRFDCPVNVWVAGDTALTVKEILQVELLGMPGEIGSGMIPEHLIVGNPPRKPGVPEGIETVRVQHASGGISHVTFKSYEMGRKGYQGTSRHIVWFDEEPPDDIYTEAITRTAIVPGCKEGGMIMLTYTPLSGLSKVVMRYSPSGKAEADKMDRYLIHIEWEDVPHLDEKTKNELKKSYSAYELDARTKGIPAMGIGAIYPISDDDIKCKWFDIPKDWPRFYGFDYGYNRTAACFFAIDPSSGVIYLYDEYVKERDVPAIHAAAIKAKGGSWMWGASESGLINSANGKKMIDLYKDPVENGGQELNLIAADKSWDAGVNKVWQYLSNGQLKVFETCHRWFQEKATYHKDEKGRETRLDHDEMDCTRYGIMTGINCATVNPDAYEEERQSNTIQINATASDVTGY
ncbi:MAG: terminase large subunit domain-containing protein, partial [Nitrospiria bacterium]